MKIVLRSLNYPHTPSVNSLIFCGALPLLVNIVSYWISYGIKLAPAPSGSCKQNLPIKKHSHFPLGVESKSTNSKLYIKNL